MNSNTTCKSCGARFEPEREDDRLLFDCPRCGRTGCPSCGGDYETPKFDRCPFCRETGRSGCIDPDDDYVHLYEDCRGCPGRARCCTWRDLKERRNGDGGRT